MYNSIPRGAGQFISRNRIDKNVFEYELSLSFPGKDLTEDFSVKNYRVDEYNIPF